MSKNGCFRLVPAGDVARLRELPAAVTNFLATSDPRSIEIHKAWQGLHYLLTGEATGGAGPLAFIVHGGREVGEDVGQGRPRLFEPDEITVLDAALQILAVETIAKRFDAEKMNALAIYPGTWVEKAARWRGSLIQNFEEVRALVKDGAEHGMGLLVYYVGGPSTSTGRS